MYTVPLFEAAWSCHFKIIQRQTQCKRELWQKVTVICKHWANKVIVMKQYQFSFKVNAGAVGIWMKFTKFLLTYLILKLVFHLQIFEPPASATEGSYKIGSVSLSVLLKLSIVLGTHIQLCVTESDFFWKKFPFGKNHEKWSKMAQKHSYWTF